MEVPQGAEGQDTQTSLQALIKVLAGILCPQLAIQTLENKAWLAHRDSSPEPPAPAELKDVAVTLCPEPSCCTEPPAPKQAPTCPHANSMRDRLSLREAHSAQCTPGSTLVSPCRPSPRPGPRMPEPPSLTRPPRNFPGAQLGHSARPQRLGVLRHAALLRLQPDSAPLSPAAPCAPCGVPAAAAAARAAWEPGTRRERCGQELRRRGCCRLAGLRGPLREGGTPEGGGSSAERRDGGGRGSARRGVGEPRARFLEGGVTGAGANLYSGASLQQRRQSALYTPNLRSEAT